MMKFTSFAWVVSGCCLLLLIVLAAIFTDTFGQRRVTVGDLPGETSTTVDDQCVPSSKRASEQQEVGTKVRPDDMQVSHDEQKSVNSRPEKVGNVGTDLDADHEPLVDKNQSVKDIGPDLDADNEELVEGNQPVQTIGPDLDADSEELVDENQPVQHIGLDLDADAPDEIATVSQSSSQVQKIGKDLNADDN